MSPGHRFDERGASIFMVTIAMLLLAGAAAVAVDLAAMRLDRSADQKVTDSAAASGALTLATGGSGQDACVSALGYVEANTPGVNTGDLVDPLNPTECAPLAGSCDSMTAARTTGTITIGRLEVSVVHPVPDGNSLMTSAQLGAPTQPVVGEDGEQCDRVGVELSAVHQGLFAPLLGFGQGTTTVHTVATASLPSIDGPPLNLLVLDRFGCNAMHVQGNGGVIVNAVIDPDSGDEFAGLAAADSDASSGCSPAVIHIEGSNAVLRADGPPGCADEVTPGTGEGCGLIQTIAPGVPGCNPPACQPGAGGANPPVPEPTELPERLTRAQIDYEYNCWSDYTSPPATTSWAVDPLTVANEQDIPGCGGAGPAHIYDLITAVGPSGPAGHTPWTASQPCNVTASQSFTVSGDTWIDCADFIVEGDVTINSGNVIFDGNVHVKSDGSLNINPSVSCPTLDPSADWWAFMRDGRFKKDGQANVVIEHTAVYLSNTSWIDIAGGSFGKLCWTAPDTGNFDDLALWSDSPSTHFWAGQGDLDMIGVFFTPWATADYSGTSSQNQTKAQWIADKLIARGQGKLEIQPAFEFPFKQDGTPRTILIR